MKQCQNTMLNKRHLVGRYKYLEQGNQHLRQIKIKSIFWTVNFVWGPLYVLFVVVTPLVSYSIIKMIFVYGDYLCSFMCCRVFFFLFFIMVTLLCHYGNLKRKMYEFSLPYRKILYLMLAILAADY